MNIRQRYHRLSLWNKIAFWGSLASLIGIAFIVKDMVADASEDLFSPVSFNEIGDYFDSFIYIGVSEKNTLKSIQASTDSFSTTPFISFNVTSDAKKYHVQIAPYLVINIVQVEKMPKNIVAVYQGERGGASEIREFIVALVPNEGTLVAPHVSENRNEHPKIDFYTLSPGESESFMLYFYATPGYIYTYRIGVQYSYKERNKVEWLPKTYKIGVPATPIPVFGWENSFKVKLHPDINSSVNVVQWAKKSETFLDKSKIFKIDQIQP